MPVRIVTFDKTADQNWQLPWHQDRVISVKAKKEVTGYTNWSRKSGLWHCEPPLKILNDMLAVRIHLDNSTAETGAIEILKGSHKYGKVYADKTPNIIGKCESIMCEAKTGDILIMKMLTLHRSQASKRDATRRAIRVDYSSEDLPASLEWEAN